MHVPVRNGVDDGVLIILCVHGLQFDFPVGIEDDSGKELNLLQETV